MHMNGVILSVALLLMIGCSADRTGCPPVLVSAVEANNDGFAFSDDGEEWARIDLVDFTAECIEVIVHSHDDSRESHRRTEIRIAMTANIDGFVELPPYSEDFRAMLLMDGLVRPELNIRAYSENMVVLAMRRIPIERRAFGFERTVSLTISDLPPEVAGRITRIEAGIDNGMARAGDEDHDLHLP